MSEGRITTRQLGPWRWQTIIRWTECNHVYESTSHSTTEAAAQLYGRQLLRLTKCSACAGRM